MPSQPLTTVKGSISDSCVGEFLQFGLSARFPLTNFDTKLANFFKIGVTCYSKGNTFNFSYFFFSFIAKIITQLFFAAAVSEPEASERGSSLIGKKLHYKGIQSLFLTKRKELWLCAT